jgi:hypothetical protein
LQSIKLLRLCFLFINTLYGKRTTIMRLTRRFLLKLFAALGVMFAPKITLADKKKTYSRSISLRALSPFVDTLIPEDTTPSASQLGVDRALIDMARTDSNIAVLLVAGCEWLDKAAQDLGKKEFTELDQAARDEVVRVAEDSPRRNLSRMFFDTIRHHAFRHYYAQPASWQGLGYSGPPQPRGFPDHVAPPKSAAS